MELKDYDFPLPEELIAQEPVQERDTSRLLVIDRKTKGLTHRRFLDLPSFLNEGDTLVLNDSKVIPARLYAKKTSGARVEILLLKEEPAGDGASACWQALLRPSRAVSESTILALAGNGSARVVCRLTEKKWLLSFKTDIPFYDYLDRFGESPLPPYIKRNDGERPDDRDRYQTVYAQKPGSVAAPTAGLHFTPRVLEELGVRKVKIVTITLHVGYGTFQPLQSQQVENNKIEEEYYEIGPEAADAINSAKRVVAVGTTSMRTLEGASDPRGLIKPGSGWTDLYIYPGYRFKRVDALITNFHLPRSSLFLLVCAFAGQPLMTEAYGAAVEMRYRFYSYGDCSLIV